jgi:hypothetical protein
MKPTASILRIAPESFFIAGWQMIWPQSTGKAQMKTILMLIRLLIASPSEGDVKRMCQKFCELLAVHARRGESLSVCIHQI